MIAKRLLRLIPNGFVEHARLPLYRNAYALILSSAATSGLGYFYWILAAHLFPAQVVGLNAAVLSASLFIASAAQFNLNDALIRFLPAAGRTTRRLILSSYLISTVVIVIVSLVFLLGISTWAPRLSPLSASPWTAIGFVLFSAAYGIFVLQDGALTGMRQTSWVPVENTIFAVLKIALLFVFARMALQFGVLASWLVATIVVVVGVNLLLWSSFVSSHSAATSASSEPVTAPRVAHYVAGDYFGGIFWIAVTSLQTVIVAQVLGTAQSAYFYLIWQIVYSLFLVSRMMGMSLVAEVVTNSARLDEYRARALKQLAWIVLPAVAVVLAVSPWLLRLFGPDYAEHGSNLMRLLSLSAIPQIVIAIQLSLARIQRRASSLFAIQASESILTLIFMTNFLVRFGINGLGWAWLLGQTLVAAALLFPDALNFVHKNFDLRPVIQMYHTLRMPWVKSRDRMRIAQVNAGLLPRILASLPGNSHESSPQTWRAKHIVQTVTGLTVIMLAAQEQEQPVGVLKIAYSKCTAEGLRAQSRVLASLRADNRLQEFRELMPELLAEGTSQGQYYSIESILPGYDARTKLIRQDDRQRMLVAASHAICDLHARTLQTVKVDASLLSLWVDARLTSIRLTRGYNSRSHRLASHIERVASELKGSLHDHLLSVSWIHGDYAPGNILVTPDAARVAGLVDWGLAAIDLPQLDLIYLLLSVRSSIGKSELGRIVRDLLNGNDWSPEERALLRAEQQAIPDDPLAMRTLLLLCWLRHVSSNITKSEVYRNHLLWFHRNVETVLEAI